MQCKAIIYFTNQCSKEALDGSEYCAEHNGIVQKQPESNRLLNLLDEKAIVSGIVTTATYEGLKAAGTAIADIISKKEETPVFAVIGAENKEMDLTKPVVDQLFELEKIGKNLEFVVMLKGNVIDSFASFYIKDCGSAPWLLKDWLQKVKGKGDCNLTKCVKELELLRQYYLRFDTIQSSLRYHLRVSTVINPIQLFLQDM